MNTPPKVLSTQELLSAVEHLDSGFAIYSPDFRLIFANKTLRGYFPVLYKQLEEGIAFDDAVHAQVHAVFGERGDTEVRAMSDAVTSGMRGLNPMDILAQDMRTIRTCYAKTSDGNIVGISTDITPLRAREKELRDARKAAEHSNKAKSDFLASMTHELRTQLNGISGMAQALEGIAKRNGDQKMSQYVDVLTDSTETLVHLINDTLDISKIEAGKMDLNPSEQNPRDFFTRLYKSFEHSALDKDLEFKIIIDKTVPPTLTFDPVRVKQCVTNLLTNAFKFTEKGSVKIGVKFDHSPHKTTVFVADSGIGLTANQKQRLFQRFSQAEQSTHVTYGGTGLGLAISRQIAQMMGGDISVASRPGEGSIFVLTFESPVVIQQEQKTANA